MPKILSSVACNLDSHILLATLPLFQTEKVEAIEWSFDALFKVPEIPVWFLELLTLFSQEGRLIGHGVFFSLFSGQWSKDQEKWLEELKKYATQFQFDHVSEHFGFMTGENFHQGAPISIPFTNTTLAIGIDRLKRIYEACECPVGLENLAFAYSLEEVKQHGAFLNQLVEAVNGFIILDLHNLYCQIHNFEVSFEDIIALYPLDRVREIHISGGSWEDSELRPEKPIRRDTHDDSVPNEVFQLLGKAIPLCPNLKFVVLEQLGTGLRTPESKIQFQKDFLKMDQIIDSYNTQNLSNKPSNDFLPKEDFPLGTPLEDHFLSKQQMELSEILENAPSYQEANTLLLQSSLAKSEWAVEHWEPHMVETVMRIAQKWKDGFV